MPAMDVLPELLGGSPAILALKERIARLLSRQSERARLAPVLILGETGTGKGLVARALHGASPRRGGPFVDINCAAIPETLLESELFGFERGAFTDARQAKAGLFQTAHRGTIFLDEVGAMPPAIQAKLLKVIEERVVRRLGSTRTEAVDAWIVAATNEDLLAAVQARRFREDLYHRLAVVTLTLPPLRERREDIPLLAEHFLARACADYGLSEKTLAADARAALRAHDWKGNVRDLLNVMERVALLGDADVVTADALGLPAGGGPSAPAAPAGDRPASLEEVVDSVERRHLADTLRELGWNVTRAAARLGISRDTLRYRIAKYQLRGSDAAPPKRRPRPGAPGGASAPAATRPDPAAPATVRWEERRITLLRTTLEAPAGTDPRLYPSWALELLVEKVQSFGGRVEEASPTGLVAAFGLEPMEDAPRRAAHAAMAIQKAVERVRGAEARSPAVRCAVHVGLFLVGSGGSGAQIDLDGKRRAWSLLDGLVARAAPGDIVASEAASRFLERGCELAPLGEPGGGAPAYRLTPGDRAGLGRRLATFAGRTQELELLGSRLALAMQGHGQGVGILGEAGIGKSRLVHEFRRTLETVPVTLLEGRCQSYGAAIPYLPILDILRQNFRITDLDGPEAIAEKVRSGLAELEIDPAEWAPYLLRLFGIREGTERLAGLAPGAVKFRTFEALRQMGLHGSRRRPIVFFIEDLQWIDATSEECFSDLLESLTGAPALFLTTYRPGYRPPWGDRSYATQMALQPLAPEHGLTVLRSIRDTRVPERLARLILDRAEGNPFFIEELSRAVETGAAATPGAVPETIHAVLLARIERLDDAPRRLLQAAAVLGRQAPLPLLRALWDGTGEMAPHLRELTRLEFLYRKSGGTEPVYAFVHTLTQEVAYDGLPAARREALHRAAGRALEAAYAGRREEVFDRLSYHFSRAGEPDRAIHYLTQLADRAAGAQAHREAVRILEEALRHAARLPESERGARQLELLIRQAYQLLPQGRFQEIVELLDAHRELLERLGNPAGAGPYHLLLARSALFLGDDRRATEAAAAALAEATRAGDESTLGRVYYMLTQQASLAGRAREALEHGRRAVDHLERAGDRVWQATTHWMIAVNHAVLGTFDAAMEHARLTRSLGEAVGDPQAQSTAAWAEGIVHALRGDGDAAVEACRRALELAPDALNTALASGWLGYVHLEGQDPAQAIPPLEQAIKRLAHFRFPQLEALFTAFLADAERLAGAAARAQEQAGQALGRARASKSPFAEASALRTLGRLAQAAGDRAGAAAHLAAARAAFEAIGARYEVARTDLDRAAAARAAGDLGAAAESLRLAARGLAPLSAPGLLARVRALGQALGVALEN
jgi:DNA-binding NtrC family response regulator/tetratricopeptide (TPR) repeat protein